MFCESNRTIGSPYVAMALFGMVWVLKVKRLLKACPHCQSQQVKKCSSCCKTHSAGSSKDGDTVLTTQSDTEEGTSKQPTAGSESVEVYTKGDVEVETSRGKAAFESSDGSKSEDFVGLVNEEAPSERICVDFTNSAQGFENGTDLSTTSSGSIALDVVPHEFENSSREHEIQNHRTRNKPTEVPSDGQRDVSAHVVSSNFIVNPSILYGANKVSPQNSQIGSGDVTQVSTLYPVNQQFSHNVSTHAGNGVHIQPVTSISPTVFDNFTTQGSSYLPSSGVSQQQLMTATHDGNSLELYQSQDSAKGQFTNFQLTSIPFDRSKASIPSSGYSKTNNSNNAAARAIGGNSQNADGGAGAAQTHFSNLKCSSEKIVDGEWKTSTLPRSVGSRKPHARSTLPRQNSAGGSSELRLGDSQKNLTGDSLRNSSSSISSDFKDRRKRSASSSKENLKISGSVDQLFPLGVIDNRNSVLTLDPTRLSIQRLNGKSLSLVDPLESSIIQRTNTLGKTLTWSSSVCLIPDNVPPPAPYDQGSWSIRLQQKQRQESFHRPQLPHLLPSLSKAKKVLSKSVSSLISTECASSHYAALPPPPPPATGITFGDDIFNVPPPPPPPANSIPNSSFLFPSHHRSSSYHRLNSRSQYCRHFSHSSSARGPSTNTNICLPPSGPITQRANFRNGLWYIPTKSHTTTFFGVDLPFYPPSRVPGRDKDRSGLHQSWEFLAWDSLDGSRNSRGGLGYLKNTPKRAEHVSARGILAHNNSQGELTSNRFDRGSEGRGSFKGTKTQDPAAAVLTTSFKRNSLSFDIKNLEMPPSGSVHDRQNFQRTSMKIPAARDESLKLDKHQRGFCALHGFNKSGE